MEQYSISVMSVKRLINSSCKYVRLLLKQRQVKIKKEKNTTLNDRSACVRVHAITFNQMIFAKEKQLSSSFQQHDNFVLTLLETLIDTFALQLMQHFQRIIFSRIL